MWLWVQSSISLIDIVLFTACQMQYIIMIQLGVLAISHNVSLRWQYCAILLLNSSQWMFHNAARAYYTTEPLFQPSTCWTSSPWPWKTPQRTFYIQARILPYWLATKNCQMIPNNPNISKHFKIQSNISKYDQILSEYCPTSNISAYQRWSTPLSFHSPGDRIWKDLGLIQALPVRCGVGGTQSHIACQHVVRAWQCCIWLQWFNRLTHQTWWI